MRVRGRGARIGYPERREPLVNALIACMIIGVLWFGIHKVLTMSTRYTSIEPVNVSTSTKQATGVAQTWHDLPDNRSVLRFPSLTSGSPLDL